MLWRSASREPGRTRWTLGGYPFEGGPRLVKALREALGPEAQIIAPDAWNNLAVVEGAGVAAEGFSPTIAVLPNGKLPPAGREFAAGFEERFRARPCCVSVHSAQAAHMMLDAIADSDGARAQVLENLFDAQVDDGYIGDFEIDRYGDTTLNKIAVYRIVHGRLRFQTATRPGLAARPEVAGSGSYRRLPGVTPRCYRRDGR